MSLPSTGQISFSDARNEFSQSNVSNYAIGAWGIGAANYPDSSSVFAPINVHSDNSDNYSTGTPMSFNTWHGYNHTSNYASDGTNRSLFFSFSPATFCYPSSMIVFDAGTTNKTYDLTISGSSADFTYVSYINAYYGKPWQKNGLGYGANTTTIYSNFINGAALNTTQQFNYTYDSNVGQYIYVVIYGNCP